MKVNESNPTEVDDKIVEMLQRNLANRGFKSLVLNNEKEVKDFINMQIPDEQVVGLGDSITTCKLNIRNILYAKGSTIFYSWDGSEDYNRSLDTFEPLTQPRYYLSRISAIRSDGVILMKDYSRQGADLGHYPKHVYAFAGLNRICDEFEDWESIRKYALISEKPTDSEFTVALLPFLNY